MLGNDTTEDAPAQGAGTTIEVVENGPLLVHGSITVRSVDGKFVRPPEPTALCRCGGSASKPYCDGTHRRNGFHG